MTGLLSTSHRIFGGLSLALYRYVLLESQGNKSKYYASLDKCSVKCPLFTGLLAQIKERTLTKLILGVNFVITPLCVASHAQERMSERELNSLLFYKVCMSEMTTWRPLAPPPVFRQVAQASLLSALLAKWAIYFKMWITISRRTNQEVPDSFLDRCKTLSELLFGQLIYATAEMLPIAVLVVYIVGVAIFNASDPEADKIFIMLTVPSINLALLPTIQIFATPAIRADLKQCLIRLIRRRCEISASPRQRSEVTLQRMNGSPENLRQHPQGET